MAGILDGIIQAESGGNPLARNPRSSAYGAGQFIDSTWLDMLAKHRPDLITGKSREEILALRSDPELSKAMTGAYASENARLLEASGLPVTPGSTYLAHFAGPKGAVGVMKADPSAPVSSVLGEAAVKANPFLSKMTVADLRSWADKKMSGGAIPASTPAPAAQPDATMAALPAIPPQAQAQGGNPQAQMMAALSAFGSLSPPEMKPPDIPPPKRRIDLERLRMAMAQAPSPGAFSYPSGWSFT